MLLMLSSYPEFSVENLQGLGVKGEGNGVNRSGAGQERRETLRQKPLKNSKGSIRVNFNRCYRLLPLINLNVHRE